MRSGHTTRFTGWSSGLQAVEDRLRSAFAGGPIEADRWRDWRSATYASDAVYLLNARIEVDRWSEGPDRILATRVAAGHVTSAPHRFASRTVVDDATGAVREHRVLGDSGGRRYRLFEGAFEVELLEAPGDASARAEDWTILSRRRFEFDGKPPTALHALAFGLVRPVDATYPSDADGRTVDVLTPRGPRRLHIERDRALHQLRVVTEGSRRRTVSLHVVRLVFTPERPLDFAEGLIVPDPSFAVWFERDSWTAIEIEGGLRDHGGHVDIPLVSLDAA